MPLRRFKINDVEFTGIKTSLFQYEILLPKNYAIRYDTFYDYIPEENISDDLDYSNIFDDYYCKEKIAISRIGERRVIKDKIDFSDMKDDEALELFEKLVDSCLMITLWINRNFRFIEDISIDYLSDDNVSKRIFITEYKNILKMEY